MQGHDWVEGKDQRLYSDDEEETVSQSTSDGSDPKLPPSTAGVIGFLICSIIIIALIYQAIWGDGLVWHHYAVLGFVALAIGAWFYQSAKKVIASSKLGDVNVEVTQAEPGDPLSCTLNIPLLQDAVVNAVTAKLQVFEVVVWSSRSGSMTTTNKKITTLFEEKVELVEAQGQVDYYEASLEIPNDCPPTFEARNNYIVWQLSLRMRPGNAGLMG